MVLVAFANAHESLIRGTENVPFSRVPFASLRTEGSQSNLRSEHFTVICGSSNLLIYPLILNSLSRCQAKYHITFPAYTTLRLKGCRFLCLQEYFITPSGQLSIQMSHRIHSVYLKKFFIDPLSTNYHPHSQNLLNVKATSDSAYSSSRDPRAPS